MWGVYKVSHTLATAKVMNMAFKIRKPNARNFIQYKSSNNPKNKKKKRNPGISLIKSKFNNDCAVASVAMALRIPYFKVLKNVVKHLNFRPNSGKGLQIVDVLSTIGYTCETNLREVFYSNRKIRVSPAKSRLSLKGPMIVSAPSMNIRICLHAIVVQQGVVYDSSNFRKISPSILNRTRINVNFNFEKSKYVVEERYSWNDAMELMCQAAYFKARGVEPYKMVPKEGPRIKRYAYWSTEKSANWSKLREEIIGVGQIPSNTENDSIFPHNCDFGTNCPNIPVTHESLCGNSYICEKCGKKFELNAGFELVESDDIEDVVKAC